MSLQKILKLRDGATAGPWSANHCSEIFLGCVSGPKSQGIVEAVGHVGQNIDGDLDFIVSIHDAVAMLEAVEKYAEKLAEGHVSGTWQGLVRRDIIAILEGK